MERKAKIVLIIGLMMILPMTQITLSVTGGTSNQEVSFTLASYSDRPFDKDRVWNHANHEVLVSKTTGDMEDEAVSPWWADFNYGKMWLGVLVTPSESCHIKIGFTGSLSVKLTTGFWPAIAKVTVSVVICDASMNEKDSNVIYEHSIGMMAVYKDTEYFSYSTKYTMDGAYTLLQGNNYYACVKFQLTLKNAAECHSYSGDDASSLEVTRISWDFY